jgi:hypothetical protein
MRHDIKISDPPESIPVARISKFPLVDSVRVISGLGLFVDITWVEMRIRATHVTTRYAESPPRTPRLIAAPKGKGGSEKVSRTVS